MSTVTGLLLAAGAGRRMGRPKALLRTADGTAWVAAARQTLLTGGCHDVVVVLGAAAEVARAELGRDDHVVIAEDWERGMGASLAAGLRALQHGDATTALVHLVDLPDVGADVVSRVLAADAGPATLARAAFDGRPGHPVLLGRDHWSALAAGAGDAGARHYLASQEVRLIECGDLASGTDADHPHDLDPKLAP